ncbi:hypothetical protein HID58_010017 [Brassica napus]|uniref:Uncharacterized protein n=1 Tax=Brassica napus TaxID=3708 RepID=A0ABQ8DU74_BRANA|nr:hypothetical protein HID58_010017 [Brassica napus]
MGNTCTGPKLNPNGFLQSVSAAVWRNQKPDESLESNKDDSSKKKSVHGGDNAPSAVDPTPSTPPPPVKMANEEAPKCDNNDENPKPKKEAHMKRMASAVQNKMGSETFLEVILAILLPPVGVFLRYGCGVEFWICLLLTLLGYIPGIIYAIYVLVG